MAGFNQLLLAGNPWPIGAITHLLSGAQGNYKLPKYTHSTGAHACTVLMELGQETVVCGYISQSQPLTKALSYISYLSTWQQRQKLWSAKPISSSPKTLTLGFSLPCIPYKLLKFITLILTFQNIPCLHLWFCR